MTKIVALALAVLALLLPQAPVHAAEGVSAHRADVSAAKRKKPRYSRAHCMKLNPEKARLYGICREYLR